MTARDWAEHLRERTGCAIRSLFPLVEVWGHTLPGFIWGPPGFCGPHAWVNRAVHDDFEFLWGTCEHGVFAYSVVREDAPGVGTERAAQAAGIPRSWAGRFLSEWSV